jgi:serine/threonine-protein kinase
MAPHGAAGLEAERAMVGIGAYDPAPTHMLDLDWPRLVHKSGLDREIELEQVVHEARFSFVARARRKADGRRVALKSLSPALWEDPVLSERFRREGEILAALDHPNLVRLVDRGVYGYARWLMIEWVDGEDFGAALEDGPLDVPTVFELEIALCSGLEELHRHGLIHRDIKPENILWDRAAGRVVLTDFGLAKLSRRREGEITLTLTNDVMGTVGYLAPECMRGSKYVDHRVDIFAAGVVVYELGTGEPGPQKPGEAWAPRAFDPRLDDVIAKATAHDPSLRYETATAMREDLARRRPRSFLDRVFRRG